MFNKTLKTVRRIIKTATKRVVLSGALLVVTAIALIISFVMPEQYKIYDGDNVLPVKSLSTNAANIIKAAGITLGENDSFKQIGNTILLDRSYSHIINSETILAAAEIADSVTHSAEEDFFDDGGADLLKKKDEILPAPIKIEYVTETVKQTVKFGYKTVYSDDLSKGVTKVTTKGVNGQKEITYRKKTINGMVVSREKTGEKIIKEAVTQVQTIGTRTNYVHGEAVMTSADVKCISEISPPKPIELDKNGRPVEYKEIITGKSYAYSGDKSTAIGVASKPGYVAVNPKQIPYGTRMYVVSADGKYIYGYCIAADTGNFAKTGTAIMDLRMNTEKECNAFGRRDIIVYILP